MKINVENNTNNKLIWVTVSCSNLEEIELREQFYKTILSQLLDSYSIDLITVEPQDYSLAYEIIPYHSRDVGGNFFLVNIIAKCDFQLIERIVSSEEFRRTLLFIVKGQSSISDKNLLDILDLTKGRFSTEIKEVIYCDDDGDSLCLYNTAIDFEQLIFIAKTLTSEVMTQTF
jgi:hypothetical protein